MSVLCRLACPIFAFALISSPAHAQESDASGEDAAPEETSIEAGSVEEQTVPEYLLGTGGPAGHYHPIGRILAEASGLSIGVETTTGSTENLVRLRAGEFDLAIAQSDRVAQARLGLPPFQEAEPNRELRTVM